MIDSVMGRGGEAEIKIEPQLGWDDGGAHGVKTWKGKHKLTFWFDTQVIRG